VWSLLGLRPDALERRLHVVRPILPERVQWLELDGLRVGDASVRLRFERRPDGTVDTDAEVRGRIEVSSDLAWPSAGV
jgi:hypothetical protein